MSEQTAISWCDSTFNPWIGCTKVSPACDHCYAARQDAFRRWTPEGWGGPRKRTSDALWKQPKRWNAAEFVQCASCGHRCELREFHAVDGPADWTMCPVCSGSDWHGARRRVFCASLADVFDNQVPREWRADLFALIEATPNLDWLLLTKRIGNVAGMVPVRWLSDPGWPSHARLGITICNQPEADRDIGKLLALGCPNFLSIEPMLGAVDLTNIQVRVGAGVDVFSALEYDGDPDDDVQFGTATIDWVICGGESGPQARPMHPDWVRSLRDQCAAAGVPFHFKQWGEWGPCEFKGEMVSGRDVLLWPDGTDGPGNHERNGGFGAPMERIGTKAAGRLLDGAEHNGFPA